MKYKVFRTDYLNLEWHLNKWYQEFPNYHLYQIIYLPCDRNALMVVFEQDDLKAVTIDEQTN